MSAASAREPPDLRLAGAAAAAWAATALGELSAGAVLWCWLLCGIGVAAGAGLLAWRRPHRRAVAALVALTASAAVLAGGVALQRLAGRACSPVTAAAEAGAVVWIEGVAQTRAHPVGGSRDRVLVDVDVDAIERGGARAVADGSVVVLADAASWGEVLPGATVSVRGTAHRSDDGGAVLAFVVASDPGAPGPAPRWSTLAQRLRDGLQSAAAVAEPDIAGLLVAIVDGDSSGIGPIVVEDFRASGLAHLLAVSGANVAIVVAALLWLLRLLSTPFAAQVAGAAAGLLLFVLVAGPEPSVLRATAMGAVMLLALATGRPRSAIPALSAAVLVLVMWLPALAVSAGFTLSVLATAGIVLLGTRWTDHWARALPRPLAAALAVAASATVSTLPVVVLLRPTLGLGSVLANVLAAPAVPLATILGVAATAIAWLWLPAAQACCFLAGFPLRWIAFLARVFSEPGPLQIALPAGLAALAVVSGALVSLLLAVRLSRTRPRLRAAVAGTIVGALVLGVPARCAVSSWPPREWLVAACDVGQGDAVLARAGPGSAVLLDAGPDPALLDACLRELGVHRLSLVVLSHFHDDHVAGITGVLGRLPVDTLAVGTFDGAAAEVSIRALAGSEAVPVVEVTAGWRLEAGDVEVAVLGPARPILGTSSDPNNNSLIVRVTVDGVSMIVTGDAQSEEQAAMAGCGCLSADILKVAHHGSKNRDDAFTAATGARIALISVGEGNDYGHPAPSTLSALTDLGMSVRRTDREGTVVVVRAGGELRTMAHRSPR